MLDRCHVMGATSGSSIGVGNPCKQFVVVAVPTSSRNARLDHFGALPRILAGAMSTSTRSSLVRES